MSKVNYLRIIIIILPRGNNIFMGMSHRETTAFLAKKTGHKTGCCFQIIW